MGQEGDRAKELESAFLAFNQLSQQLAHSYRALQDRVSALDGELAAARDARLAQAAETERLANRLQHLLRALPAGVIVVNQDGEIREHNDAAEALLGTPLRGAPWREVAARRLRPLDGVEEFALADGRRVHVRASRLGDEPGQILLLQDVTQTRELQEQLNRHQRLYALGEMAASLAHQIRTPLAAAMLYICQITTPHAVSEHAGRVADKVLDRLRHLERLVNDMLLFARGGGNAKEEIALPDLFQHVMQAVEPALADGGCTLACESVPDIVLYGNRDALSGALQNLAINAVQACGPGGRLRLSAAVTDAGADGACLNLAVVDNGPGVPTEMRARIFEPFFTTRAQGTGLGLAVVQAVARAHGGEAWLDSRPGDGSTFGLRLPLQQARVALHSRVGPCAA